MSSTANGAFDGPCTYIKRVTCPDCGHVKTRAIPNCETEIRCSEQCLECGALIFFELGKTDNPPPDGEKE